MAFVDDDVVAGCAGTPPSGRGCAAATGGSCRGWRRSTATVRARIAAPRAGCRRRRRSARRAEPGHRVGERTRGAQLVVAERLGRRQVQRPGARIRSQRRQYRQLVGQRLARRGAGAQHDVAAVMGEIGRRELMRPRRVTPRSWNARTTSGSAQCGHACGRGPPRRQISDVAQRMFVGGRCPRPRKRAARGRNPTPDLPLRTLPDV